MEEIDWTAEFNELTEFEDSQWSNATFEERQEALQELVDTLDVSDAYEGYTFQTADLPDGDFVAIDSETNTITFDRDALNSAEAKDSIINDLFEELNIDEQIVNSFDNLYHKEDTVSYDETAEQYSEVGKDSYGKSVYFGGLGICGTKCVMQNLRGVRGRDFQVI